MRSTRPLAFLLSFAPCVALGVAAFACVTVNAGCSGTWSNAKSGEVQRNATVADAKSLVVETRNGGIVAKHDATATEMKIDAKIRCSAPTQEEADERVKLTALVATRETDGTVRVKVSFPPLKSGEASSPSDAATIEVIAADLSVIELTSSNGQLRCEGFACTLKAQTSNGAINVNGNRGAVTLKTSNGAITATGVGTPASVQTSNGGVEFTVAESQLGNIDIQTSNGSVQLTIPAQWDGHVDAHTSNGKVSFEGASRATNSKIERGEGTMDLGDASKATAKVRSSNGSVRVRIEGGSTAAPSAAAPSTPGAATAAPATAAPAANPAAH